MIREYIPTLLENHDLTREQAEAAMMDIMTGQATPSQISAFLIGLKKKGETVEEITAIARVMRSFSRTVSPKVDGYLLDTCGTGGDRTKTFNVSTTAAFVIAAAGVRVAKHGNRSSTSRCGSADLLEQLGLKLEVEPALVEKAIEEIGIGFMFAPNFHPAMKNVASIRREIGVRTVFNILGPLTNPAGANAQLIGVYDSELLEPMCDAAYNLGAKSVMTVYGLDGVDEISLTGKTAIVRQQNGRTVREEISPEDLGLNKTTPEMLAGGDPEQNARLTARILSGHLKEDDPRVQIVVANLSRVVDAPLIMKDIIVSPLQVQAAARAGARAVVLISELFSRRLTDEPLDRLIREAGRLGVEILLEANNPPEFRKLPEHRPDLYGINNRNLSTFKLDLSTTERVLAMNGHAGRPVVSESGIEHPRDIVRLKKAGANAFLVGTSIMKSLDVESKVRELVNA